MGFSGTFVVLRSAAAPSDLVLTGFEPGFEPEPCADEPECRPGSVHHAAGWEPEGEVELVTGWRVWRYYGALPSGYLQALTEAAATPVVTAMVVHSDAARVEGLGLRTGRWAAWLMVGGAAPYFETAPDWDDDDLTEEEAGEAYERAEQAVIDRLLADAPGGEATARQAVAWAEEVGLAASPDAVLAALDGYRVFAEEAFFDLLTALGIQSAEQPGPL